MAMDQESVRIRSLAMAQKNLVSTKTRYLFKKRPPPTEFARSFASSASSVFFSKDMNSWLCPCL